MDSHLKDKINSVLCEAVDGYHRLPDEEKQPFLNRKVDKIVQQVADEGYIYIPTLTKGVYNHSGRSFIKINENEVMTGAEWYARFEKELDLKTLCTFDDDGVELYYLNDILLAAKRAAGIEEEGRSGN